MLTDIDNTANRTYARNITEHLMAKRKKLDKLLSNTNLEMDPANAKGVKIVNLSSQTLTKTEESVLSKGLTFCPYKPIDEIQFFGEIECFFRRMRLKEFYNEGKGKFRESDIGRRDTGGTR